MAHKKKSRSKNITHSKRASPSRKSTRPISERTGKRDISQQQKRKLPSKRKKTALRQVSKTPTKRQSTTKYTLIITSYKEKGLKKAIEAVIGQQPPLPYEIMIVSPEKEAKVLAATHNHMTYVQDQGKGKVAALNQAIPQAKGEILILTDGDVLLEQESIKEILKPFSNPRVGCVGGRVISSNSKKNMLGFWSHLLADAGAHNIRKEGAKRKFLECSGYLFAFRNKVIQQIPTDVAEDTFIPYMFKQRGYDIDYAPLAKVKVKNPTTVKDWIKQRKRTAKAHDKLYKYVDTKNIPQVKTFSNEIRKGFSWAWSYPSTTKEYAWTLLLCITRFYMWTVVTYEAKLKKKQYTDKWKRIKTAR